jgi:hypothetical protein
MEGFAKSCEIAVLRLAAAGGDGTADADAVTFCCKAVKTALRLDFPISDLVQVAENSASAS